MTTAGLGWEWANNALTSGSGCFTEYLFMLFLAKANFQPLLRIDVERSRTLQIWREIVKRLQVKPATPMVLFLLLLFHQNTG
jgi:hypothetical protein